MKKISLLMILLSLNLISFAQNKYQPTEGNLKARQEFQDQKFGVFLHWGIYSMLATGEWTMNLKNLNYKEYAKLASGFYPSKFDAAQWVSAIKDSGAKYICFTTRHHDGFSMFDSRYTPYNIVQATPFKRDILKELSDECARQDISLHCYYSLLDWGREDYPWGKSGHDTGRSNSKGDWKSYHQFMQNQLTELLTGYGKVGAIWFDGWWDHPKDFDWQLGSLYTLIHHLQPDCLIGNNHHRKPFDGEDFQMFERDLPGENTAGYSSGQEVGQLPLETCETMNGMWGYKIADQDYKSSDDLIRLIVKAAGKNANLLLNIGPQPNGELPAKALLHLKEIGEWMKKYGETIYGTRNGLVAPHAWGVSTQHGNKLYLHILNLQDKVLFIPVQSKRIKTAVLFTDKTPVSFNKVKEGIVLHLGDHPKVVDYIIELTLV
ncbi:MAG: alpha-L-fucosidase [Bacteroidaceae bacterium]|nr:alpha-L-fucosidase [Bacteroidaceae bacterium]